MSGLLSMPGEILMLIAEMVEQRRHSAMPYSRFTRRHAAPLLPLVNSCRQLHTFIEPALYKQIHVWGRYSTRALFNVLSAHPDLASCVKELWICCSDTNDAGLFEAMTGESEHPDDANQGTGIATIEWTQIMPPVLPHCTRIDVIEPWDDDGLLQDSIPFLRILRWCSVCPSLAILDLNGLASVDDAHVSLSADSDPIANFPETLKSLRVRASVTDDPRFWALCTGWVEVLYYHTQDMGDISKMAPLGSSLKSFTFVGYEPYPETFHTLPTIFPLLEELDFALGKGAFNVPYSLLKSLAMDVNPDWNEEPKDYVQEVLDAVQTNILPALQSLTLRESQQLIASGQQRLSEIAKIIGLDRECRERNIYFQILEQSIEHDEFMPSEGEWDSEEDDWGAELDDLVDVDDYDGPESSDYDYD